MMNIDLQVAEKVMGWRLTGPLWWVSEKGAQYHLEEWHPSIDIAQALQVVEKMRSQRYDGSDGYNFNLNWQGHKGITVCLAQFHRIDGNLEFGQGASDNPAEAICLAALEAVEGK